MSSALAPLLLTRKAPPKDEETFGPKGHVYFIGYGDKVKIGFAKNVSSRLWNLQCGMPEKLRVFYSFPTNKDSEALLHKAWKHLRIRGEWYLLDIQIQEFWDDHIEEIGDGEYVHPNDVAYLLSIYEEDEGDVPPPNGGATE